MATLLPLPSLMVAVAPTPENVALIGAALPAVIVVDAPPATMKLEIVGFALSTCRVPLAVAVDPSPAVSVAVNCWSPSANAVVTTSKA